MADAKKINPYDIEALEKSLNDSATRVSTIWISFLIFSLYLLITAVTVEHRQLLLAEPVKLPVLNIDLPLWGFFFLAPILFVIFHIYVLLQVLLLGRTAAAYNEAIDRTVKPPLSNAVMRQRLANTLFAQIFAGSPRERDGWLGWLLRAMAWITLAIAPIFILFAFQIAFLPYHSHLATWAHRILILVEVAAALLLWPLVLDAQRDFSWHGFRSWAFLTTALAIFVVYPLYFASFPGEPHVNLFTGQPLLSVQCNRLLLLPQTFDRLHLPGVDVVDDEKLAKIVQATSERKLLPSQGERTRNFRDRNLDCGDLSSADLRRVDLTNAHLSGANLAETVIEGASLDGAQLHGAVLRSAKLQNASATGAGLQGADLDFAQLQLVSLISAHLQGATLRYAGLQAANLNGAELQGATLDDAFLQGASLEGAQLAGASLDGANLQGSSFRDANAPREGEISYLSSIDYGTTKIKDKFLRGAQLQGASLDRTLLQGTSFDGAQLQGASIDKASWDYAHLHDVYVWRTKTLRCGKINLSRPRTEAIIEVTFKSGDTDKPIIATPEEITRFIERAVADIPNALIKSALSDRIRTRLMADQATDDASETAKTWNDCEAATKLRHQEELDGELVFFLRNLVCNARDNRNAISQGVAGNWIWASPYPGSMTSNRLDFSASLARNLLGADCAARQDFSERTLQILRDAIADSANAKLGTSRSPPTPPTLLTAPAQ